MRYINWGLINIAVFFAAVVMYAISIFTDGDVKIVYEVSCILLNLIGWIMVIIRKFKQ